MLRGAIYVLCVAAVFVAGRGVSYAEGTHLDLSNASISVTGAETFRISHTTIPGLEGAYWVDFQWNPVDLVFAPVAAGSDETTASGVLACVAYRAAGTSDALVSRTGSFQLSNLNDNATITINKIFVYDNDGALVCEGPSGWDNFATTLAPNGGTWFSTNLLATWCNDLPEVALLTVKLYWSTSDSDRVFPLYGTISDVTRDLSTNMVVGRSAIECETLY